MYLILLKVVVCDASLKCCEKAQVMNAEDSDNAWVRETHKQLYYLESSYYLSVVISLKRVLLTCKK